MKRILYFLCLIVLGFALNGCSSSPKTEQAQLLIPLPPNPIDPSDQIAHAAVKNFLKTTNAPMASTYDLRRYDLDGDGRREAIVFLKSPYRYWCGTHGCTMLVMHAQNDNFKFVNDIQPIRAPLFISSNKSQGWHDLIVRLYGRQWEESRDVALRFDGRKYPRNPETAPHDPYLASYNVQQSGVRLFYD